MSPASASGAAVAPAPARPLLTTPCDVLDVKAAGSALGIPRLEQSNTSTRSTCRYLDPARYQLRPLEVIYASGTEASVGTPAQVAAVTAANTDTAQPLAGVGDAAMLIKDQTGAELTMSGEEPNGIVVAKRNGNMVVWVRILFVDSSLDSAEVVPALRKLAEAAAAKI